jgi:hypothetical protein
MVLMLGFNLVDSFVDDGLFFFLFKLLDVRPITMVVMMLL